MTKRAVARAVLFLTLNTILLMFYQNCAPASSQNQSTSSSSGDAATGNPSPTPTPTPGSAPIITVNPAASTATFNNPERGFHNYTKISTSQSSHQADINAGSTLALLVLDDLAQFSSGPISTTYLSSLQAKFDMARNIGLKFIMMPSYFKAHDGHDPALNIILNHVSQIASIMNLNKDVIFTMHAGFIGAYGEWYYTDLTEDDKKTILLALLNALDPEIKVAVRTPGYKQSIFGMVAPGVATTNQLLSNRVGFHNDCFVASADDEGTGNGFSMGSLDWRMYISSEVKKLALPVGGETCAVSPYASCMNSLFELGRQGWSYISTDYHPDVLQGWKDNGCFNEINQRLGYRFKVNEIKIPSEVSRTGTFQLSINMENNGFASMVNPHTHELVLINVTTGVEYYFNKLMDPRKMTPGLHYSSYYIDLSASGIPAGDYNVAIAIRDNAAGLKAKPAFSVQFANSGVWVAAKGYNKFKNGSTDLKIKVLP